MPDNLSRYAEGTFKNFFIHRVRSQDVEKLCQHVKDYFLHDEPTSKLIGYSEEYGEEFCKLFKHALSDNLSFWMEDTETGEVITVCTWKVQIYLYEMIFLCKGCSPSWNFRAQKRWQRLEILSCETPVMKIMYRMSQIASDQVNHYEKYGISEYANLLITWQWFSLKGCTFSKKPFPLQKNPSEFANYISKSRQRRVDRDGMVTKLIGFISFFKFPSIN